MSTLFIVATPIGNLQDISLRAIETLQNVEYIACEDTRTSNKLFHKFGIDKPTFSYHQYNEHKKLEHILTILQANQNIGLVSDAGMPGISDPGFLAIRAVKKAGHQVIVIPGPDAATTALVASGLPSDRYVFEGFLPHKKGRQKKLKQLAEEERTIILYESPRRLIKLISEIKEYFGCKRKMAVARELTKTFEEVVRASVTEVYEEFKKRDSIKGEIVVVIAGKGYSE